MRIHKSRERGVKESKWHRRKEAACWLVIFMVVSNQIRDGKQDALHPKYLTFAQWPLLSNGKPK